MRWWWRVEAVGRSGNGRTGSEYDAGMARRANDFGNDSSIDVVNPDDDTSREALAAWIAALERDDDWIELPTTAAVLIDEDRNIRGS